jgi:hypothetical protein
MFKFRLPIGDWSNDGHGKCDYFVVSSNEPVEKVREAHFKARKEIFDIENFMSEYCENSVDKETYDELPDFVQKRLELFDDVYTIQIKDMAMLWIELLMMADPELKLIIEDDIPMLPFYGSNNEGQHIDFVGYGLYD